MNCSDADLVRQTLAGDSRAFDKLAAKYQTAVYALAYRWTGNFADAQDLAQECLTQAFEKLDRLRDPGKFSGWLRATATNVCRMWYRGRYKRLTFCGPDQLEALARTDRGPLPDAEAANRQARQTVVDLLDLLSDKVGLAARLFYVDGLSSAEIAAILAVERGAVEGRLHKARQRLRKALRQPYAGNQHKQLLLKLTTLAEGAYTMDAIRIELGTGLVPFVEKQPENNLLNGIKGLRKDLEEDQSLLLPPVRVIDKSQLSDFGYTIHFHEAQIAQGDLSADPAPVAGLCRHLRDAVLENRDQFPA